MMWILDYMIVFFVLAVVAGLLGFGGVEFAAIEIVRVLFFVFLVLFVVSLVMRLINRV